MATAQDTGILQEWGQLWAGKWTIQGATPGEGGAIDVASGSQTINWMDGNQALEGLCIPALVNQSAASAGTRWIAVLDSASGAIKQSGVGSDGTTEVAFISKLSTGQWGWQQTRSFPNGSTETNTSTFTLGDAGRTVTQRITNRVLNGAKQPLAGYLPAQPNEAPALADVCMVATRSS
jgi:hypothetical protein